MRPFNAMHPDVCADCGAVVFDERAHDRFHDILNDQATAIAMLLGAHLSPATHDRWDVNNWSAEALTEGHGQRSAWGGSVTAHDPRPHDVEIPIDNMGRKITMEVGPVVSRPEGPTDDEQKAALGPREPMCDHICLKDDGHVERRRTTLPRLRGAIAARPRLDDRATDTRACG